MAKVEHSPTTKPTVARRSREPSPSAPTIQTIGSELPSLVVTIGEPAPLTFPHHAGAMVGRSPALIFKTVSWWSDAGDGQETPGPRLRSSAARHR